MALTTGPGTTTGLVPFRRPYYAPWGMPLGLERPRLSIDRRSAVSNLPAPKFTLHAVPVTSIHILCRLDLPWLSRS